MPRAVTLHVAHPRLRLDRRQVVGLIHTLDTHASSLSGGPPVGELSIAFLTDPALAKLHGDFLADPSLTDVITFEGEPGFGIAGEICVSVDTAQRYAAEHDGDFSRELTLYLIHGWLHLAGYDDLEPAKKRRMRGAERRALRLVEQADAMPVFRLRPLPAKSARPAGRRRTR